MISLRIITLFSLCTLLAGCSVLRPRETGLVNGELRPCPAAPKCVCSTYASGIHHIQPLTYTGTREEAFAALVRVIDGMDRSRIVSRTDLYLHAQFELRPIKWVDNVEFLFSTEERVIDLCSSTTASVGYWDWGENRRRAKKIRRLFQTAVAESESR